MLLQRYFYLNNAQDVAKNLLGKIVSYRSAQGLVSGIIVETEAYLAEGDASAHGFRGMTNRNKVLFGEAGHAYVYGIHRYFCLNASCESEGRPAGVLIRAIEPIAGIEIMQKNRGKVKLTELTNGPGKLCQAMGINLLNNGMDLTQGDLTITDNPSLSLCGDNIVQTSRIGITKAIDMQLRYYIRNNLFVSRK